MDNIQEMAQKLVHVMDNNNSFNTLEDGFCIGTITSIEPLIITVQSLPLYEEDFLIPYYLKAYTETIQWETTEGYINRDIIHPSKLQQGRKVFLYGIEPDNNNVHGNYQRYVILGVQ